MTFMGNFAETQHDELHPDLVPWVEQNGPLGPMLRHPLVYEIALFHNGMANAQYAAKRERLAQAEASADWHSYIFLHERPHRFDALLQVQEMAGTVPADLVRSVWMDSENVWQNYEDWLQVLEDAGNIMDEDDQAAFDKLPTTITVYRGAQADLNEDGLSWTLDRDRAAWFARRFSPTSPILLQAQVRKTDVIAVLLGRGEDEILAFFENVQVTKRVGLEA